MKRICIIGSGGAGKTTLANRLHKILDIPIIHLDRYFWNPNWIETPKAEWEKIVQQLIQRETWIMDGNYGGTMDIRLPQADTVIFLDFSRWLCSYRILKRWIQYRGKTRPDLPDGCPEQFDWKFLHYVFTYRDTRRPGILNKLKKVRAHKKIFILSSPKELETFLKELERNVRTP